MGWTRLNDNLAVQQSPSVPPDDNDDPWGLIAAPDPVVPPPSNVVRLPVPAATLSRGPRDTGALPLRDEHALDRNLPAPVTSEPAAKATWLVAAITVAAIAAGVATGVVAWMSVRNGRPAAPAVADTGLVVVSSHPAGAAVRIDGTAHGVTPAAARVSAGHHRIDIDAGNGQAVRTFEADIAGGGEWRQHLEFTPPPPDPPAPSVADGAAPPGPTATPSSGGAPPASAAAPVTTTPSPAPAAPAPAAETPGWVLVQAPFDVQVLERGRALGPGRRRLPLGAGRHEIEVTNAELGYRSVRSVNVVAELGTSVTIDAPTSTLDVNALPWAEVTIDGRPYGETPLASVSLPIGEHNVVLRHPSLGERTAVAVVGLRAPNRLSVDLRK